MTSDVTPPVPNSARPILCVWARPSPQTNESRPPTHTHTPILPLPPPPPCAVPPCRPLSSSADPCSSLRCCPCLSGLQARVVNSKSPRVIYNHTYGVMYGVGLVLPWCRCEGTDPMASLRKVAENATIRWLVVDWVERWMPPFLSLSSSLYFRCSRALPLQPSPSLHPSPFSYLPFLPRPYIPSPSLRPSFVPTSLHHSFITSALFTNH